MTASQDPCVLVRVALSRVSIVDDVPVAVPSLPPSPPPLAIALPLVGHGTVGLGVVAMLGLSTAVPPTGGLVEVGKDRIEKEKN